jgi:copper(I)-binding protein
VKRRFILVLMVAFLVCACSAEEGMTVHNAWMRPVVQGENGAVYFVLHNHSAAIDELVAAASSVAETVEIHESSMVEGTDVMQMKQVFSVPIDGRSETAFEPGGLHVMLVNISRDLTVGDHVELTLQFKNDQDLLVDVSVAEFAPEEEHSH